MCGFWCRKETTLPTPDGAFGGLRWVETRSGGAYTTLLHLGYFADGCGGGGGGKNYFYIPPPIRWRFSPGHF